MAGDTSSQVYLQTCCIVIPLRLGVMLSACLTFLTSLLYVLDRDVFQALFRHFTGGYALASKVCIGTIEVTGVFFGLLGILGCWYARHRYVVVFNMWQFVRLGGWLFMYWVDIPLMAHCEDWVNNIETMTKEHGWNKLMYEIAMGARCENERQHFFVLSALTLLLFLYIVWSTARYADFMGRLPKHLLRVPKDLSSGAFYAHSMGERCHLNGMWGKNDVHKFGSDPYGQEGPMPPMLAMPQPGAMSPGFGQPGPYV